MPVRCGDCVHVTKNLSGRKYRCKNEFLLPEVRPRRTWKCPYNNFSPTTRSRPKYRKYGRYWGLKS